MVIYLVRHACAGQKGEWIGPDSERPLDPAGRRQAAALDSLLSEQPLGPLISSPTRRCIQTLEPLAATIDRDIERSPLLRAEVAPEDLLGFLVQPSHDRAVLCSHGEAMSALLPVLRAAGTVMRPLGVVDDDLLIKGTVWHLEVDVDGKTVRSLDHLRPSIVAECGRHRQRSASGA